MQELLTHKWLILSLLVAALAGRMLLTTHHFYVHDDIQVFRVNEFINCFKRYEIPCRWAADLGKGYGMPWFNYYPPMIYAIPSLIHLTGLSIITSLNIFMFLTFLMAAWGMFLLVKELTKQEVVAFFGSVLFTLYPFHATNVFLRGVYAENLVWSLAPLVLLLVYRQITRGKFSKLLPFLFAFIFLTHVISSFLIVGMTFLWVLMLGFKKWRTVLIQILVGLGISTFFLIPALLEKDLVQSDSLIVGYYSFINHFVSLKQLFIEYKWNYGSSYWGEPPQEMGFMVGHIHTILLALLLILTPLYHKGLKKLKLPLALLGVAALALFLTHSKSTFIWNLIPPLAYIQFPWRFIGWAGIPLVIAISLLLSYLPKKISYALTLITLVCLFIYSYPFFFPREYDNYNDQDFISGQFRVEQQSKALFDYLPVTVHQIPIAQSGTFYFPGWTANVSIAPNPDTGLIEPRDGISSVTLSWKETPFRLAMDLVSILSVLGYSLYVYKSHVQ